MEGRRSEEGRYHLCLYGQRYVVIRHCRGKGNGRRENCNKRRKYFQAIAKLKHGIELPDNCEITRLDILAPCNWWEEQDAKLLGNKLENDGINIRPLCVPSDFIPADEMPKDIPVSCLPKGFVNCKNI